MALGVQISWQAQDFLWTLKGRGVQISWQAQDFVDLEVQISWQVQDFVDVEGQRSADFMAGPGLCGP